MEIKDKCPSCFKALSVPVRSKIYNLILKNGEISVNEIVNKFKLTQPTISYHLKDMENVGLIKSRKVGRRVIYSVAEKCFYGEGTVCYLYKT